MGGQLRVNTVPRSKSKMKRNTGSTVKKSKSGVANVWRNGIGKPKSAHRISLDGCNDSNLSSVSGIDCKLLIVAV